MSEAELPKIKCGLEIHQMLDTSEKLFCSCPTRLTQEPGEYKIWRRLRLAKSEMGEVDPAALFEYEKGVSYLYECYNSTTCLVEMDEEPPHELNREALELAIKLALMVGAHVFDEIHVMRKIVIDGSNTTGFQRTVLVAVGGSIQVGEKVVPIQTICLEEDAARKISEDKSSRTITYRLDRLGTPLIEVATAPVISSPEEAREVALRIGLLLRSLGRVKRELGSIRQDLNISVEGGAKIEVKGVQYLDLIPKVVAYEALRQRSLLEIRDELIKRGVTHEALKFKPVDVTRVFAETKSRIARQAISTGGVAMALKLPGFKGLLGREIQPGRRLGTELADRARYWAEVGGLFHSDELPGYGITEKEVEEVKRALGCGDLDAFILVFESREKAEEALRAAWERALEALQGVPEETRAANPDGTTRYMRPRPGSARMYPETDVRPIRITKDWIEKLKKELPEPPEKTLERLVEKYSLPRDIAWKLFDTQQLYLFEELVEKTGAPPLLIASTLTNTLVSLRREGVPVENISEQQLASVLAYIAQGAMAKEAIPDVLKLLATNPGIAVEDALKSLGGSITEEELRKIVREVLAENSQYVREKGERAFGKIMGLVMEKVRGKADGRLVSEVVRDELRKFTS
uniref:Glutamyl-tRNA(Gln) amidotransferase subunit E n=2 Tax=Thermofilum pendens TaxID=2269 RepID=A0A7J3X956_THEPE